MSYPRSIAERAFKIASAEAALFELRIRIMAGVIPITCDEPIETKLSILIDPVLEHYKSAIKDDEAELLRQAYKLRNKLLHCEFSEARKRLNEANPKNRSGGVWKLNFDESDPILGQIRQQIADGSARQNPVSHTKTKALKDVIFWLLEGQGAGEFDEAASMLSKANALLERLAES